MNDVRSPPTQEFGASGADHLALLVATAEIGLWELDLRTGSAKRNLRHDQIFGYPEQLPEWTFEMFLQHVADPDECIRIARAQEAALRAQTKWAFETQIVRADGRSAWISAAGTPVLDAQGEPARLIGHVLDITPFKRAETRLRLVTGELQHRVKNLMTIVTAMVRISARRASSVTELQKTLEARLAALSETNDLLAPDALRGEVALSALIETELAPFDDLRDNIRVTCPADVAISGAAAEALALALHELLSNALKHGALSQAGAWVELTVRGDPHRGVRVEWRERGVALGDRPGPANGQGFGKALLHQTVEPFGRMDWTLEADGLRSTILLRPPDAV